MMRVFRSLGLRSRMALSVRGVDGCGATVHYGVLREF